MSPEELVESIENIYDAELLEDAYRLSSLWLSMFNNDKSDILRARVHTVQADCLSANKEFHSAIENYNRVLYIRKQLKLTNKQAIQNKVDDATICFKLYKCHIATKNYQEARKTLESVSPKYRPAKINIVLARMYENLGQDRTAQTFYKEAIREYPLLFDAVVRLASLGGKTGDMTGILLENFPVLSQIDWISAYLKAENLKYTGYYLNAVEILRQLSGDSSLKYNMEILLSLAECEYFSGNHECALGTYSLLLSRNYHQIRRMDIYSSLLYFSSHKQELSSLLLRLNDSSPNCKEAAIAHGFYSLFRKKLSRANIFSQNALAEDERNIEARILKGLMFLNSKKRKSATAEFSKVYQTSPYRYEIAEGMLGCHHANGDSKSALMLAQNIKKNIVSNPKFAILYANTIASNIKDVSSVEKACVFLEGVHKSHPDCLEVVYALVELCAKTGQFKRAGEMLKETLRVHSNSILHYRYGCVLLKIKNSRDAMEHFNKALLLDPSNKEARKAVLAVDIGCFTNIISDSDIEPDLDTDSEIENELR